MEFERLLSGVLVNIVDVNKLTGGIYIIVRGYNDYDSSADDYDMKVSVYHYRDIELALAEYMEIVPSGKSPTTVYKGEFWTEYELTLNACVVEANCDGKTMKLFYSDHITDYINDFCTTAFKQGDLVKGVDIKNGDYSILFHTYSL